MPTSTRRSPGAITCKFRNSGQTCISANRMLVQEGIYDDFLERFTKAVRGLKVADGFAEGVNVGPLIDEPASRRSSGTSRMRADRGAEVVVGGERIDGSSSSRRSSSTSRRTWR
jgi:succinate-semialdehyde dehydrogenase/glutarate-semialdehyde dehydrogenase